MQNEKFAQNDGQEQELETEFQEGQGQPERPESHEEIFASWEVPEYNHYERDFRWYAIAITVGVGLMVFSFFSDNFLLPVIVIITAFILIMRHGQEPEKVKVSLGNEGLTIGQKFFDYDEFRHFAIVYKPKINDKNLYFEFKTVVKPRISIPLMDMNPVEIRRFLISFMNEDQERTDIPFSEQLAKRFKL